MTDIIKKKYSYFTIEVDNLSPSQCILAVTFSLHL